MIEIASNIINFLGVGNVISILVFSLSTFIAFYFYYRTFYRLVYSTGSVNKNFKNENYLPSEKTIFKSRVVFYNNGRKTLTKKEINKLEIICSNEVLKMRILKTTRNLKTIIKQSKININIEYLDSSDFFVLEIIHKGQLEIKGQISETGKLLDTETKTWLNINIAFLIFFIAVIFYNIYALTYLKDNNILGHGSSITIIIILFYLLRHIHKLFFIPYKISSKYLGPKDKLHTEFRLEF